MKKLLLALTLFKAYTLVCAQTGYVEGTTEIESILKTYPVGMEISVGLYHAGEITKYGYLNTEQGLKAKQNSHTLYEIGSITKTFTATLLAQLVVSQQLSLNDPIDHYLPFDLKGSKLRRKSVTLKHLVTHTSGLSNGPSSFLLPYLKAKVFSPQNPYKYIKTKHYFSYLKKIKLEQKPDTSWSYNNAAIGLLGTIAANKLEDSWEHAVGDQILGPLGMVNTTDKITSQNRNNLVQGHNSKGRNAGLWEMDFINPAGGLKSNVDDMLKWVIANIKGKSPALTHVVSTVFTKIIEVPMGNDNTMGFGWVHKATDAGTVFWHSGGTGGYSSFVAFDPDNDKGIVILTNYSSQHPLMRNHANQSKTIKLGFDILKKISFRKNTESNPLSGE